MTTVKIVYRILALVLTLLSAVTTAILISAATEEGARIKVLPFTMFAVGAAIALILALVLWQRANAIKSPKAKEGPHE